MTKRSAEREGATVSPLHPFTRLSNKLVADELHDTVCQSLAGTSFFVKVLIRQAEAGMPVKTDDLKKAAQFLEHAMADVRAIAARPESLAGGGFVMALNKFAHTVSEEVPCRVTAESNAACDPELAVMIYGLVRWTIRRVMSSSASISIDVMETGKRFNVEIQGARSALSGHDKQFLEHSARAAGITIIYGKAIGTLRFSVPALRVI